MRWDWLRLAFAAVWAAVGAWAAYQRYVVPADQRAGVPNLELVSVLAAAFAVWNVVRWRAARGREADRRPAADDRHPLRKREPDERREEYHPEFDFGTPSRAGGRQPPPNGG